MRTKICSRCQEGFSTLYRVQLRQGKDWVFCCKKCTEHQKTNNRNYRYGGTWKG
ncbi:MAG: hypothetical protein P8O04_07380 [Flavobacteriaceae bacterium]|nr:hypothetical protein [Flavobacteriales bacterium]MDG1272260.1 hypothetical protein [Flavobacteriaceae bacterium]